jgi:hypothetical protein
MSKLSWSTCVWGCSSLIGALAAGGCGSSASSPTDAGGDAAPGREAAPEDAGHDVTPRHDATPPHDARPHVESGHEDAGHDSGVDAGHDSGIDAGEPDAHREAAVDGHVAHDAASDAHDAAALIHELYLLLEVPSITPGGTPTASVAVVSIDGAVISRQLVVQNPVAIGYANGSLYVVEATSTPQMIVVDAATLVTTKGYQLPFTPTAAAFNADATHVYLADTSGDIDMYSPGNGVLASTTVTVPSGSTQLVGIAVDATETHLAVAENNGGTSSVAELSIGASSFSPVFNVTSQPISGSNCGREASAPSFSPDGTLLSTFDPNCVVYDMYVTSGTSAGTISATPSVRYTRTGGASSAIDTVWTANNAAWTTNDQDLYLASETGTPASSTVALPSSDYASAGLAVDATRSTLYFVPYDPATNGSYTVNTTTGAFTATDWDLSTAQAGADVYQAIYVAR